MSGSVDRWFNGELARIAERGTRPKSLGGKNIGRDRRGRGGKRGARSGRQKVRVAVDERRRVNEDRRHWRRGRTTPFRVGQEFLVNIGLASFLDTLHLVKSKERVGDGGW
jgi:hypothetical protein